ncbi:aspartyl/asparaginyl beta-hydroxylase domain-containing protein [Phenylobacterium sp.]|uniref:aspartyl/asparaginyl beta-hydroxylase domain-containing protein n=1 Tax=Phenylobacterium sp. TaxID=1871053 RepID=UPI0027340231|nr:aspartyl/asparaginyl beta-hydroxylase domain-containing protein [Phenylobacterium sp.]MDP3853703.1 aspartyl/asparaginyl beta-hydroxylase domain-containing protein [Phenylobacterium sp.]
MNDQVNALVQAAGQAANSGRWQDAERLWGQVRALAPDHPQALYSLGVHAFQRRDLMGALELLQAAHAAAPRDPLILMTTGVVLRERGDVQGEWEAINAALTADPYFLPGLISKAGFLERQGRAKAAAGVYRDVLKVAPPQPHWPDSLRPQLLHAAKMVEDHTEAFAAYLEAALAGPRTAIETAAAGRWAEAASIMSGRSKPYLSDSNQLYVPRLPAIPFHDRAQFTWVEALEAQTDLIREELQAALADQQGEFSPYIAYNPGEPVNQWAELNHSNRWSTYPLWRGGTPVQEHLDRCPKTAQALRDVEMAEIGGLCPNAMFSALAPHTQIPPHHGETNARLVVHLPLVVPPNCTYRVGFERTGWTVGEVLIFDDTIEHEARNDSDELRVVLIFDVWNPLLSKAEREMVQAMTEAARAFNAEG